MNKKGVAPILILIIVGVLAATGVVYYSANKSPAPSSGSPAVKPPAVPDKNYADNNSGQAPPQTDLCSKLTETDCLKNAECTLVYKQSFTGTDEFGMPLMGSVFDTCKLKQAATQPNDCSGASNSKSEQCKGTRDAQRTTDLRMVQVKLELYYSKFGRYPQSSDWPALTKTLTDANLNSFPVLNDPLAPEATYVYGADSAGSDYILGTTLEDAGGKTLNYGAKGTIYGLDCSGQVFCIRP
ncbi:MAG: hypothetical protein LiPW15_770 [Parcubacteria group bacterium LiPW_15]|nr:MAG: hypothetical protein LiPW15_770 [Parcubacteria group bacterium LiPW_15]